MTKTSLIIIIIIAILSVVIPIVAVLLINRKRKLPLVVSITIPIIVILIINSCGMLTYFSIHYHATSEVYDYLNDDSEVKVTRNNDYYLFDNVANEDKAIIFYGGAKVQEKSYAPMLNKIAHLGTDVYLVNMPFSFPLFARNKADSVYRTNNTYSKVYLMGHSLGGVCAAMNLEKTTLDYEGIIFLAAYPSHKIDDKYKALSIYGSEDHVMNLKEYTANSSYFPSGYVTKVIEGANHANYGYYGKQKGDGVALLTREQQIDITISYVKDFIN